jgi:cytochrome P450
MRLCLAAGLNIACYVPPDGAYIDGVFRQGGTRVAINGWVLHRDQATFGKDAEIFRPERWLESNAKETERHMYQVSRSFSSTPWCNTLNITCI